MKTLIISNVSEAAEVLVITYSDDLELNSMYINGSKGSRGYTRAEVESWRYYRYHDHEEIVEALLLYTIEELTPFLVSTSPVARKITEERLRLGLHRV